MEDKPFTPVFIYTVNAISNLLQGSPTVFVPRTNRTVALHWSLRDDTTVTMSWKISRKMYYRKKGSSCLSGIIFYRKKKKKKNVGSPLPLQDRNCSSLTIYQAFCNSLKIQQRQQISFPNSQCYQGLSSPSAFSGAAAKHRLSVMSGTET